MIHTKNKKAFTLIELAISMSFISFLLLAIANTIIQITSTYNRGITIKSVTKAGSDIATSLKNSISNGLQFDLTNSKYYINTADGGRLCLGNNSYIWNYGKSINNGVIQNKYLSGNNTTINFVVAQDAGNNYCINPNSGINPATANDILTAGDRNLSIQSFSIRSLGNAASDPKTGSQLYTINFYIGTNTASALNSDYLSCKDTGQTGADLSYCYVGQFSISVSAGNVY